MSRLVRKGVSPATILANRANGVKSRGPVSARGKSRSRLNALKHWGRSEGMRPHLPALGEQAADFDDVRERLYRSLAPRDDFEAMLVDDMADIRWRLGRLIRAEAAAQGARRLERMMQQAEREAALDAGKLHDMDRFVIGKLGYFGLNDTPAKFDHILAFLKAIGSLVREQGFSSEGVAYLQIIYGKHNEGEQAAELAALYKKGARQQDSEPADGALLQSYRQAFLELLENEINRFAQRAAAYRQARAHLQAPRVDAEVLNPSGSPLNTVLCLEALERTFERKWFLLMRYREGCGAEREHAAGLERQPAAGTGRSGEAEG